MNNLVIADDKSALARDAWKEIQAALKESANDDKFLVALSGGSLPQVSFMHIHMRRSVSSPSVLTLLESCRSWKQV